MKRRTEGDFRGALDLYDLFYLLLQQTDWGKFPQLSFGMWMQLIMQGLLQVDTMLAHCCDDFVVQVFYSGGG